MIYFLIKHWRLFLDIILVIAAIVAFTLFDPFGMFTKTKTRATANMVTGVRDIGQLITAEYYGEVISSWKEFKLTQFQQDTLTEYAEDLFIQIRYLVDGTKKNENLAIKVKEDELVRQYDKIIYDQFIAFIGTEYFNMNLKGIFNEKGNDGRGELKKNAENKILRKLRVQTIRYNNYLKKKYKKENKDLREELIADELQVYLDSLPPFVSRFNQFHTDITNKIISKGKNRRKNIVFIGRGSVKAGFDFGKLDESNFMYDEENKTVHFYGILPLVLDADINPWFIPEQKVKGFELVDYSGSVNFEDAKAVKKQCKEKLLDMARRADILGNAAENGKEALKNFFSILLEEPDLKVEMHVNPFDIHYNLIAADTLIDLYEARYIDTLYMTNKIRIDSLKKENLLSLSNKESELLKRFINKLKMLPFIDFSHKFSYYSLKAAEMLEDSFYIDRKDYQKLIELRGVIHRDSEDTTKLATEVMYDHRLWFSSMDFMQEFNSTISLLTQEMVCPNFTANLSNITNDEISYRVSGKDIHIADTSIIQGDTLVNFTYVACAEDNRLPLEVLLYDDVKVEDVAATLLTGVMVSDFDAIRSAERTLITNTIVEDSVYQSQTRIIRELHTGLAKLIEKIKE